jgi:uncharacterized membrane protein
MGLETDSLILLSVSSVCMLTQLVIWTGYIIYAWKTPLKMLKLLAVLFVLMNAFWFVSVLLSYIDVK